jgi:UDP-glucose 4-epimerase
MAAADPSRLSAEHDPLQAPQVRAEHVRSLQGAAVSVRRRVLIVGGAGFLGSHFLDRLLSDAGTERVTIYDNFSSGQEWHYAHHASDPRLAVVRGDANDLPALSEAMDGHDLVIHLASNPDIAAAMADPAIDFDQGTLITHHVVEAMRRTGVPRIAYASGSGVYGDLGEREASEDHGPMVPVSPYGASKLAGEALISAYAHMFAMKGHVYRFGNVVGRRQTHGVGFDFVRRLRSDPRRLTVQGDGTQSKSYVLAGDVVAAVLTVVDAGFADPLTICNVATGDYVTVREIVAIALEVLGLSEATTTVEYGPSPRGWKGDVPVVRLATDKIRSLGWRPSTGSAGAIRASIQAMLDDLATQA